MREIKFRGKRIDNGELIYGDLLTGGNEFAIINDTWRAVVVPESVAQLVGYDKNGAEVYEGDTLIDESGFCKPPYNKFVVRLKPHGCKYTIDADGSRDYSCVTFEMRGHNDLSNFRLEEKAI